MPLNEPHAEVAISQHDLALPVPNDFIGGDGISDQRQRNNGVLAGPDSQEGGRVLLSSRTIGA
jgi:hypothetical protein